ncbi:hypothetical protein HELRODRAFT_169002 [Helobdella robusta]|uniref:Uncharacterized protein n=1 Tax=Helobdella robusta TaxID=6412 RepID=T1F188_HELRO|nr:hypothetical protein HELRODRAFT_169002 [Helobdella robusta]ESO09065.1 hypothetical protein HELRODRAFT_169002 [Helobdella robusta]
MRKPLQQQQQQQQHQQPSYTPHFRQQQSRSFHSVSPAACSSDQPPQRQPASFTSPFTSISLPSLPNNVKTSQTTPQQLSQSSSSSPSRPLTCYVITILSGLSFVCLFVALVSDNWLHTQERVSKSNGTATYTVTKSGLWTKCSYES